MYVGCEAMIEYPVTLCSEQNTFPSSLNRASKLNCAVSSGSSLTWTRRPAVIITVPLGKRRTVTSLRLPGDNGHSVAAADDVTLQLSRTNSPSATYTVAGCRSAPSTHHTQDA